ncbi:hypothetical protein R1flu_006203 [Riccia fluitans]|uniref:Uncharacterized protein n=1 Tax=Riccia fluitans TaxID=41844 RepID=A0ABD1YWD4_9MARC
MNWVPSGDEESQMEAKHERKTREGLPPGLGPVVKLLSASARVRGGFAETTPLCLHGHGRIARSFSCMTSRPSGLHLVYSLLCLTHHGN